MNYPSEILPGESRKFIDCDLSDRYLVRYLDSSISFRDEFNLVNEKAICSPKEHIVDLSTSLLGVFKPDHNKIGLTPQGKDEYAHYCSPDQEVEIPTIETHFYIDNTKGFWHVLIGDINGKDANFSMGPNNDKFYAKCLVIHTPMLWNFWHFSVRWQLADGRMLQDLEKDEFKKYSRRLSGEARGLIRQFANNGEVEVSHFPEDCYVKSKSA